MEIQRARAIAEQAHRGQIEPDGSRLLPHVARVARTTPAEARAVAWLHEVLEWTPVSEQELLTAGLTDTELRALRLLCRTSTQATDRSYLAHVDMIARAAGAGGRLARLVKTADLDDRLRHPRLQGEGWVPPYARALQRLQPMESDDGVASFG